jgi:phenylacetate-CoA ligase
MLHKFIFKAGYSLKRSNVCQCYDNFQKNQWQSFELLKKQQEEQLRKLVKFVYKSVPYYAKLFNQINIGPKDITTIQDLEKLPILTKQIIKKNWQDFIPKNINKLKYKVSSTGGSTGEPLKYRMSIEDRGRGVALLYRGWGYAGYKLGDKVAVIGGSSLIPTTKSKIRKGIQDFFLNFRHYSSYKMNEESLFQYFYNINNWKPRFIRGYVSSVYLFAKFIRDSNLKLEFKPKAIFTTAEKLFEKQRELIERVFEAKVFDTYGLNDGGAILEVVNKQGEKTVNKQGKILATSLYNYALPFIRYDTGDLGFISDSGCACGRTTYILKTIIGRVTDFLKLNNTIIGSPVLTVLMGKFDIEQYQIIQDSQSSISCKIVRGPSYNKEKDEEFIKRSFYNHVGKININFNYVDLIQTTNNKKYKFIINDSKKPK